MRRELKLLDLRGGGAMRAGTVSALAKVRDRALTQRWSRYFYEGVEAYGEVDGFVYANAHNDEEAVLLYERAADALECPEERILRLDDAVLRPAILEASLDNGLATFVRGERRNAGLPQRCSEHGAPVLSWPL